MRGRECIVVHIRACTGPAKCEYRGLDYIYNYIYRLKDR